MSMRPVFFPPIPPEICRGCGGDGASPSDGETAGLSVYRVCARCQTACSACGNPTGMLRSEHCPDCRPRSRGR